MGRAWWCIIIGGIGLTIWIPIVGIGVRNGVGKLPITEPLTAHPVTTETAKGWYLIIPPVVNLSPTQIEAFPQAALSKWHTMDAYDSVADCKQAGNQYRSFKSQTLEINPEAYHLGLRPKDDTAQAQEWDRSLQALKAAIVDAVHDAACIASDDPRLAK